MTKRFPVIYEWSGKNFSGFAPDIPGCMATAKTLLKMRSALKGALEAHLQWLHDEADAIPSASDAVTVDLESDSEFPSPAGYYVIVEKLELTMPSEKRLHPSRSAAQEQSAA